MRFKDRMAKAISSVPGYVALVLHAHLPYVRHPEHVRSLEERWFFEALWECYLPLLGVLDRLAADRVTAPLTLSVSPSLLAMLRDELLLRRFEDHLRRHFGTDVSITLSDAAKGEIRIAFYSADDFDRVIELFGTRPD